MRNTSIELAGCPGTNSLIGDYCRQLRWLAA